MNFIFDKLSASMGRFWSRAYSDRDLIWSKMKGDDLEAFQEARDMEDTAQTLSRGNVPLVRKYAYTPLLLHSDKRNRGEGSMLQMGQVPETSMGAQEENSVYGSGRTFSVGGSANRAGFVAYPVSGGRVEYLSGMPFIQSSLKDPAEVLVNGVDYYVEPGVINFLVGKDPFASSAYLTRTLSSGVSELTLWGVELEDSVEDLSDYIPLFPELVGAGDPEYLKRAMNGLYDLSYAGPDEKYVKRAVASVFGVPFCLSEEETVLEVFSNMVVTDRNSYRWDTSDEPSVFVSQVIHEGDILVKSCRLYWNVDFSKFRAYNDPRTLQEFNDDVPSLLLERSIIGLIPGVTAIAVKNHTEDIVYGGRDANGNPRFRFALDTDETSQGLFWESVWARYERAAKNMYDTLKDYLTVQVFERPGSVVGKVNPMNFFCMNFLRGSSLVVRLDFGALPKYIRAVDGIRALKRVLPASVTVFCFARFPVQRSTASVYDPASPDRVRWNSGQRRSDDGSTAAYAGTIKHRQVKT